MNILAFVLLPVLVVATYAIVMWARNRQPSSVESGVDAFRREMTALSPDAAPVHRRPERGPSAPSGSPSSGAPPSGTTPTGTPPSGPTHSAPPSSSRPPRRPDLTDSPDDDAGRR